ncbi:hypothetical protein OSTOST_15064 [Ostertagia ostertagi]
MHLIQERFGLMHASTVSCIITGIKPMINIFLIGLFAIRLREHMKLIKTLDTIDLCFRTAFHLSPPTRCYVAVFFVLVGFFTVMPFTFKVVEFIYTDQKFGSSVIQDTAFVIVPTLSLWNVIPLLYYDLYNRLVRFYCRTVSLDRCKPESESIGKPSFPSPSRIQFHTHYHCEQTRGIVNAVLRIVPDANADLDRFQISCFVHKMSTQFMWGMTVWRAFPLERTTFFTLVSCGCHLRISALEAERKRNDAHYATIHHPQQWFHGRSARRYHLDGNWTPMTSRKHYIEGDHQSYSVAPTLVRAIGSVDFNEAFSFFLGEQTCGRLPWRMLRTRQQAVHYPFIGMLIEKSQGPSFIKGLLMLQIVSPITVIM